MLTSDTALAPIIVYGEEIPVVSEATYLSFPITIKGVDFIKHVTDRVEAAARRAD